jgi:serine/threonine protein kinase
MLGYLVADQFNLQPGTVFAGDFRLVRAMSAGGMGAVYAAEQISTGKQRALKVMLPQLVADPSLRKRFEQEARIASLIESEHVVEVVGAGVDPGSNLPWLAMELLNGEDLSELVTRGGPLLPSDVAMIFEQLCHAVGAAHRVGVVHRDLKPENIFLAHARRAGATYMVKVLDFGIAKIVAEASTKQTAAMGSPIWMAPEQADQSPITAATDVWALGLIAFYLLTGRSFWKSGNIEAATIPQVLKEVLFEPIVPASTRAAEMGRPLPPAFDGWFARCVAREPAHRFGDATQAGTALVALLRTLVAFDATTIQQPDTAPRASYPSHPAPSLTAPPATLQRSGSVPPRVSTAPLPPPKVPLGVAVVILVTVALLGTAAAGGVWWLTRRVDTTPIAVSAGDAAPAQGDARATTDGASPEDAGVDGSRDAGPAEPAPVVEPPASHVSAHAPAVAPTHAPPRVTLAPVVAQPVVPQPPPPRPPPPRPQRSIADLANSVVSADWWTARRVLEPKVAGETATVEEVRLLLKICRDQHDGHCQKMCKRVLAGKRP